MLLLVMDYKFTQLHKLLRISPKLSNQSCVLWMKQLLLNNLDTLDELATIQPLVEVLMVLEKLDFDSSVAMVENMAVVVHYMVALDL